MDEVATSKYGVRIRLPDERWRHILERHGGLEGQKALVLRAVAEPERIVEGNDGALMAILPMAENKVLVTVYKEINQNDGFVITAFPTRRLTALNQRRQRWP
ncbi:MAG: hypothetical protein EA395_10865 [Phormidium sp. GEM2.Bin31]|nr:hypothetical protein [Phormidium sp. BM_Day4_Bin.17]TVR08824.1 MAG: hypothetical protein EA395_10865 [Phormidium sp. GEM2.Bin31]UCJ11042.1 MAG: hypothetical protein JWS08_14680 [Phormidium sp. PBR-2020]